MKELLKRIIPAEFTAQIRKAVKVPLKLHTCLALKRGERRKLCRFRMAAFPEKPINAYAIGKITDVLGVKLEGFSPWREYDVVLAFQDNTHAAIDVEAYLKDAYAYTHRPPH